MADYRQAADKLDFCQQPALQLRRKTYVFLRNCGEYGGDYKVALDFFITQLVSAAGQPRGPTPRPPVRATG